MRRWADQALSVVAWFFTWLGKSIDPTVMERSDFPMSRGQYPHPCTQPRRLAVVRDDPTPDDVPSSSIQEEHRAR